MSKVHWKVRYEPLREMFEGNGITEPERVLRYSLLSPNRIAGIIRSCLAVKDVQGATAEVGCASGGTTRLIAQLCGRKHFACDTFEGLVDAGENDPDLSNGDFKNNESTLQGVRERAADLPNVTFIAGRFPDSVTTDMDGVEYALVHLDTDTYQSMKDGFEFFKDRVVPGGELILDDVIGRGTEGGKKFFQELNLDSWKIIETNDPQVVLQRL